MIMVLSKWEPLCFLQGRSRSGGPFWLLFAAAGKESLARQWAKPQEQSKIAVNAKYSISDENDQINNPPVSICGMQAPHKDG